MGLIYDAFKGGPVQSNEYLKQKTQIEVRELYRPDLGQTYNGADITARTHGSYMTIDIDNWDSSNTDIYMANPFNFVITDVLIHVKTPFTTSSGDPYLRISPSISIAGAILYSVVGTANAIVRGPAFTNQWKNWTADTGNSISAKAVPQDQITRAKSPLNFNISGTGLSGTGSLTITLKILPVTSQLINQYINNCSNLR
tara:strand:+ start:471 stop:1067 length:597 start_codon:yes stop_codon:yes gene_type:complete